LHQRANKGLAYVPEERSVFKSMSCRDNLRVGLADPAVALDLFPELRARLKVGGGLLSGGEQQMLALGRALSVHPKVLLVDELSLGLAPIIVRRLFTVLRQAAEQGVGILLVEQHVRQALEIADYAYVMRRGHIEVEGTGINLLGRIDEIERNYMNVDIAAE
jgi:branched-chain amino acid transport system ATP-binding protein